MPIRDPHYFETRMENLNSKLWGLHIQVPQAIADVFIADGSKRVLCTLQETETFACALIPKGDGSWIITVNKKRRDKLRLKEGTPVTVALVSDESKYGLPMPEELEAVLETDEEGNKHFQALTPGKQRNIIYFVSNVKSPDIRIRRALTIMEHLKKHDGQIIFKALNEELKQK
jgi:hypothetical protein